MENKMENKQLAILTGVTILSCVITFSLCSHVISNEVGQAEGRMNAIAAQANYKQTVEKSRCKKDIAKMQIKLLEQRMYYEKRCKSISQSILDARKRGNKYRKENTRLNQCLNKANEKLRSLSLNPKSASNIFNHSTHQLSLKLGQLKHQELPICKAIIEHNNEHGRDNGRNSEIKGILEDTIEIISNQIKLNNECMKTLKNKKDN